MVKSVKALKLVLHVLYRNIHYLFSKEGIPILGLIISWCVLSFMLVTQANKVSPAELREHLMPWMSLTLILSMLEFYARVVFKIKGGLFSYFANLIDEAAEAYDKIITTEEKAKKQDGQLSQIHQQDGQLSTTTRVE